MAAIRVFTTPTCVYCKQAKDWLREHEYEFEELDITKDVNVLREWRELSGGAGVPVIAHGNDIMIGFSEERLKLLLDCCKNTTPYEDAGTGTAER